MSRIKNKSVQLEEVSYDESLRRAKAARSK